MLYPPIRAAYHMDPPEPTMKSARLEFEEVMFTAVDDLLKKTGASSDDQIGTLD